MTTLNDLTGGSPPPPVTIMPDVGKMEWRHKFEEPSFVKRPAMIGGISIRCKLKGAVMQLQILAGTSPLELVEALREIDPGVEFETDLSRGFTPKGELKKASLFNLMIEAKGDKFSIAALGDCDGKNIKAEVWASKDEALKLVLPIQMQGIEQAIESKETVIQPFGKGEVDVYYRESQRDGQTVRRIIEFKRGEKMQ